MLFRSLPIDSPRTVERTLASGRTEEQRDSRSLWWLEGSLEASKTVSVISRVENRYDSVPPGLSPRQERDSRAAIGQALGVSRGEDFDVSDQQPRKEHWIYTVTFKVSF